MLNNVKVVMSKFIGNNIHLFIRGNYLNPLTNTCGNICPAKYYKNEKALKCDKCTASCIIFKSNLSIINS